MRRAAAPGVVILVVAVLASGCGAPAGTFTPTGPCVADGRAPGLYPALEAKLPGGLGEEGARFEDSGRNCSSQALGTLTTHGISDLRFAGATWTPEGLSSIVIAVFATTPEEPPLQAAWVEEFYSAGASASSKTENIETSRPTFDQAGEVFRLDTLNQLSFQTVIVWPGPGLVHVVIVATSVTVGGLTRDDHDTAVRSAVYWAAIGRTPA